MWLQWISVGESEHWLYIRTSFCLFVHCFGVQFSLGSFGVIVVVVVHSFSVPVR